jgi:hypothetical protein
MRKYQGMSALRRYTQPWVCLAAMGTLAGTLQSIWTRVGEDFRGIRGEGDGFQAAASVKFSLRIGSIS